MHSWLRGYLYIVLLMCISSSSFALTPQEQQMGGFAYPTICAGSGLDFCYDATKSNSADQACAAYLAYRANGYSGSRNYEATFTIITLSNGQKRCQYKYKIPNVPVTVYDDSADLSNRNGLCPNKDAPPPTQVLVSRTGRWFPQELPPTRCYKTCSYRNAQSFIVKHYVFTNGIVSEFKENMNDRLKSEAQFCEAVPEPVRGNDGEVLYESNCDDAVFTQICDFINWFRNDAEMPESPEVQQQQLDVSYIKTDHVRVESNAEYLCFDDVEFVLYLPWDSNREVKKSINFQPMCAGIDSFGNFLRVLYIIHACFVIFGGRK